MMPFLPGAFQYWERPSSDDEQDTGNAGKVSMTSQPEARATEEDNKLEIVSATDGTVCVNYSYCNCYATTTINIAMKLL